MIGDCGRRTFPVMSRSLPALPVVPAIPVFAFMCLVAASLALMTSCDGDVTLHVELRVGLSVTPDHATSGLSVTFTFSNRGDVDVQADGARFAFIVRNEGGAEVRRIEMTSEPATLAAGDSLATVWDQRDSSGRLVAPGVYTVSVAYRGEGSVRGRQETFRVE
jgi:flagellar hook capping protein FlgD